MWIFFQNWSTISRSKIVSFSFVSFGAVFPVWSKKIMPIIEKIFSVAILLCNQIFAYRVISIGGIHLFWTILGSAHSDCPLPYIVSPCTFVEFLVACTRLYNPLCPLVGWSHFTFFYDFISLTSLLLPKWSGDLKYGPCPPARDFGSRASALVSN